MIPNDIFERSLNKFPYFKSLLNDPNKRDLLTYQKVESETFPFIEGEYYHFIPLVLKGTLRVSKISDMGREIILYRVNEGESCILLISSALSNQPYSATAFVEENLEVLNIPVALYQNEMATFDLTRIFTYDLYNKRIANMMSLIEEIVFNKMDKRIIEFVLNNAHESVLEITHESLSIELGTAREVVSRVLKELERKGFILLSRGKITILQVYDFEKYYQAL